MASIRSFSTGGSISSSSGNVAKPTGTANDDRIIAVAFHDDTPSANLRPTTMTGWTQRAERADTTTVNGGGNGRTVRVFDRIAASDPTNYAWSLDSSTSWLVYIFAVEGVPAGAVIVVSLAGTATGLTFTAPSILAASYTGSDPIVIAAFAAIEDDAGAALSFTTPASMTSHGSFKSDNYLQGYAASIALSGTPASGARATTASGTAYTNVPWQAASIVVPTVLGGATVNAVLAAALGGLSATASAVPEVGAVVAAALGGLTAAASAVREVLAVLAAPLGALSAAASAESINLAEAPLGGLAAAATAGVFHNVTGAAPLGGLAAAVSSALVSHAATAAAPLGALTASANGAVLWFAVGSAPLGSLIATATALPYTPFVGAIITGPHAAPLLSVEGPNPLWAS